MTVKIQYIFNFYSICTTFTIIIAFSQKTKIIKIGAKVLFHKTEPLIIVMMLTVPSQKE